MTRRIFFVDENLPPQLVDPLARVYRQHRFASAEQANLRGVDDKDLFEDLRSRNVDAIITHDAMQLLRDDEREALRGCGLHWIGVPSPGAGIGGAQLLAVLAAVTLTGLHHVLAEWVEEPYAFHLHMPDRFAHQAPTRERL